MRNAMAVFNRLGQQRVRSWDGPCSYIADTNQLLPIQDPLEMDETLFSECG